MSVCCCKQKDNFQDNNLIHPEGREPDIPRYVEREGENANLKRARYHSKFFYNNSSTDSPKILIDSAMSR